MQNETFLNDISYTVVHLKWYIMGDLKNTTSNDISKKVEYPKKLTFLIAKSGNIYVNGSRISTIISRAFTVQIFLE